MLFLLYALCIHIRWWRWEKGQLAHLWVRLRLLHHVCSACYICINSWRLDCLLAAIRIISFGSSVDLELGEIGEDFAHRRACQREIPNQAVFEKFGTLSKRARQAQLNLAVLVRSVDTCDLESTFNVARLVLRLETNLALRVDQESRWNLFLHHVEDVRLLVVELLAGLPEGNSVAVPVLVLEIVWRAEDNESAIDHDGNLITKLLGLVHAMSSQQDRCMFQLLDQPIERASRHWVDTAGRLVQEENFGAEHESLRATQLALVSTA